MPIKQDNRFIAIKTSLGPNVLGLRSVSVQEQLSRLFQIEAELSSENGEIDLDKVIGHDVTINLDLGQQGERYFHGFVSRLSQSANQGGYAHYRATVVPWLWFLTRTSDCRVWSAADDPSQGKSVPDIIEAVFKLHGFSDYKLSLSGTYPKREFCVQYRETDFNFVSRLMEQAGIYYYFEHSNGKHTLVLADSISAHNPFPGYSEVIFQTQEKAAGSREVVTDWTMEKEVQPVATALNDFDFKKSKTSLRTATNVSRQYGKAQYEIYDYPGEYLETGDGDKLAQARLDELQSQYEVLHGQASARGLAAGHLFQLKKYPRQEQNREYLIIGTTLHADAGEFGSQGDAGGGSDHFSCNFTCIDKAQQFRPSRLTPKPIVQGPQTAIVAGGAGDEICTDAFARVKVHFHWDRHDQSDQNSSCWVRVSQNWAGKTWGAIHIPRVGQEVIIEFLEGDPDRPIITGRVYNADQTPPYDLPANKTQSGIKSRSSKGGGSANFNEIRFEDKMGSEEIYIHAEKDQNNVVEHDETTQVGHDRTENVGHDETISIVNDRNEKVGKDESVSVGNNQSISIGTNQGTSVGSNQSISVGSNQSISVGSNRDEDVGKNESVSVGQNRSLSVGSNETKEIGKNETLSVGENRSKTVGKSETITISENRQEDVGKSHSTKAGKAYGIEAAEEIVLKTGDASLTMKKDGTITLKGKDINIEGSGKIQVKASSDVIVKGSKISHN